MIKLRSICILLLMAASQVAVAQKFGELDLEAVFVQINMGRVELAANKYLRGSTSPYPGGPCVHLGLYEMSDKVMEYQIRNNDISHDFVPQGQKDKWIAPIEAAIGHYFSPNDYRIYELLAVENGPPLKDDRFSVYKTLAKAFDKSLKHSAILYNPNALWIGASIQRYKGRYFVVTYVVIVSDADKANNIRDLSDPTYEMHQID